MHTGNVGEAQRPKDGVLSAAMAVSKRQSPLCVFVGRGGGGDATVSYLEAKGVIDVDGGD